MRRLREVRGQKYGTWHTRGSGYTPQAGDAVVCARTQSNSYSRSNIDIVGYSAPVGGTRASSYEADFDGNGVGEIFTTADGALHVWNGKGGNSFGNAIEIGPGWAPYVWHLRIQGPRERSRDPSFSRTYRRHTGDL
ncbi:hypothetical protein OHA25_31385 [Nonomuraea sp. NBC_00507]|uniref:hypothetical protein n=1 Tax=Nonomuraea sp. NBC_00507 TaxID=2976002 RepID=UPI002E188967